MAAGRICSAGGIWAGLEFQQEETELTKKGFMINLEQETKFKEFIKHLDSVCNKCKTIDNFTPEKLSGYSGNKLKRKYVKHCKGCGAEKIRYETISSVSSCNRK